MKASIIATGLSFVISSVLAWYFGSAYILAWSLFVGVTSAVVAIVAQNRWNASTDEVDRKEDRKLVLALAITIILFSLGGLFCVWVFSLFGFQPGELVYLIGVAAGAVVGLFAWGSTFFPG